MFSISQHCVGEPSVHSTGLSLSERFGRVAPTSGSSPNVGLARSVAGMSFGNVSRPQSWNVNGTRGVNGMNTKLRLNNRVALSRVEQSILQEQQIALQQAEKEAEILRLKLQLQQLQMKKSGSNRGVAKLQLARGFQRSQRNGTINRTNLGNAGGRRGKSDALLNPGMKKIVKISRSPRGANGVKSAKSSGGNFFGTPKSRDELDNEIDKYMSKAKSKQKCDLDKELDEYMKDRVQAQQAIATQNGLMQFKTPEHETTLEDADVEMETSESL